MNPTELTRSIVATRNELSDATRRNPDNIYRRMPQAAQDAWDELGLANAWLNVLSRKLVNAIAHQIARMAKGGGRVSGQIDDGGRAFPLHAHSGSSGELPTPNTGMSLRDWFAGQALAQIGNEYVARSYVTQQAKDHAMVLAAHAYNIADAMIAARKGGAK